MGIIQFTKSLPNDWPARLKAIALELRSSGYDAVEALDAAFRAGIERSKNEGVKK